MKNDEYLGYVYVAISDDHKDCVKIGYSHYDPDKRAKELSSAGTIHSCIVKYAFLLYDPYSLEQLVHKALASNREVQNREWFRYTVEDAITAIKEMAGQQWIDIFCEIDVESKPKKKSKYTDIFEIPNQITAVVFSEQFQGCLNLAKSGNIKAQYELGRIYQSGYDGITQNYESAMRWYEKAAEQGHVNAQVSLGLMFYRMLSYAQAIKWFDEAAEQGNADAQYYLANMYQHGQGVSKNSKEAEDWYVKAIENGNSEMKRKVVKACLNRAAFLAGRNT